MTTYLCDTYTVESCLEISGGSSGYTYVVLYR